MTHMKRSVSVVVIFKYRRTPASTGNVFQDLSRLRETVDNTEHYICDIHVPYINMVKFN